MSKEFGMVLCKTMRKSNKFPIVLQTTHNISVYIFFTHDSWDIVNAHTFVTVLVHAAEFLAAFLGHCLMAELQLSVYIRKAKNALYKFTH